MWSMASANPRTAKVGPKALSQGWYALASPAASRLATMALAQDEVDQREDEEELEEQEDESSSSSSSVTVSSLTLVPSVELKSPATTTRPVGSSL
mmetsp:Transcript_9532/g.27025  ORF Transcript_9532/g.27025 Transcript_9532/m.27025 type:complete len:95 (-) Transcript_9532:593-877(-)